MTNDPKPKLSEFITLRRDALPELVAEICALKYSADSPDMRPRIAAAIIAAAVEVPECIPNFRCGLNALMRDAAPLPASAGTEGPTRCCVAGGHVRTSHDKEWFSCAVHHGGDSAGAEERIVDEIRAEAARAIAKFPTWPTDPLHALAVLGEEYGELTKAMLQHAYEPHKSTREDVQGEAFQTAAMALRLALSLNRYEYTRCEQHEQER